jgi:hypothetical protein
MVCRTCPQRTKCGLVDTGDGHVTGFDQDLHDEGALLPKRWPYKGQTEEKHCDKTEISSRCSSALKHSNVGSLSLSCSFDRTGVATQQLYSPWAHAPGAHTAWLFWQVSWMVQDLCHGQGDPHAGIFESSEV